jgi:hypothetical protein
MNRLLRRLSAWAGVFALLFAQLAVSAYACPGGDFAASAMAQGSMASPCDRADADQSNLCEKHCHDSGQSQGSASVIHAAFVPGLIAVLPVATSHGRSPQVDDPALLHATSPPASIRNCCFRI